MHHTARLYPSVLGENFYHLAPVLQQLHGHDVNALGFICVKQGQHFFTKLILKLLKLPKAQAKASCTVTFLVKGKSEQWQRKIAGTNFNSVQYLSASQSGLNALLTERFGSYQIALRSRVLNGQLWQRSVRGYLFACPLPKFLQLHIVAFEKASPEPDTFRFAVKISTPLLGLLLHYQGSLSIKPNF